MTSLSKHLYTGDGEDRITSLPEALLLHILSLMPTQYAVRTSILSLRWKDLWALVPSLDFEFEWMSSQTIDDNGLSFVNFVHHVLLLHKLTSIERVSFYVRGLDSEVVASRLHEWLRVAIRRHVRVIDLQMCPYQPLSLPSELFTCNTLTRLQLARELEFDTPLSSVWLPNLRDLRVSLHFPGNDTTQKLFSSCSMLEDLYIRANVDNEEDMVLNVCAPALKRLEFQLVAYLHNEHLERGMMLSRNKIVVNAPVLEDLIVNDDYLPCYSLENLSSLVSANIEVGHCCIQDIGMKEHANQIFKLLEGITNVKFLTLDSATMVALDFADDNKLPLFPNLIRLNLIVPDDYSWRLLPDLLCSAPNLATLVLWKAFPFYKGDLIHEFSWVEPHRTTSCFLSKLEKLVVIQFHGVDSELKLLKYFLENGSVLKKVLIDCSHLTLEEKSNFLEKVEQLQRVLKTCRIEHCDSPICVKL